MVENKTSVGARLTPGELAKLDRICEIRGVNRSDALKMSVNTLFWFLGGVEIGFVAGEVLPTEVESEKLGVNGSNAGVNTATERKH